MSTLDKNRLQQKYEKKKLHRDIGMQYEVMAALVDGPRDKQGVSEYFNAYLRRFGMFSHTLDLHGPDRQERDDRLGAALASLEANGWALPEGDIYALTPAGRKEVESWLVDLRRTRTLFDGLLRPRTVSALTVAAHLTLAAIKLPIAILSGSVGLLNDSLDTLMDAVSSIMVFLGMQFNLERYVNFGLVFLMLGVGALTLFESASHVLFPAEPQADLVSFAAVFASGVVCAVLFLYQRYSGLKSGNLSLITQSVDARNHVIVAAGVAVGLVATILHFGLLDALVGLGVSLLILRSGIELLQDVVRSSREEEEVDLSKYKLSSAALDRYRRREMQGWMLYLVESGRASTKEELFLEARQGLDYKNNAVLREMRLDGHPVTVEIIEQCYGELVKQSLLSVESGLALTGKGWEYLNMIKKKAGSKAFKYVKYMPGR